VVEGEGRRVLRVTESAKQKLHDMILSSRSRKYSFRLKEAPGQRIGLVLDERAAGDWVINHDGVNVLLVGKEVLPELDGLRIDTRRDFGTSTLVIDREPVQDYVPAAYPSEKPDVDEERLCGCGSAR
jgi:hypothetical protein